MTVLLTDKKKYDHIFKPASRHTDLEQFLNLRPPECFFFDHVTGSDGLQPIAKL